MGHKWSGFFDSLFSFFPFFVALGIGSPSLFRVLAIWRDSMKQSGEVKNSVELGVSQIV